MIRAITPPVHHWHIGFASKAIYDYMVPSVNHSGKFHHRKPPSRRVRIQSYGGVRRSSG